MTTTAPAPIRHAPLALWRVAERMLSTLHMLFGAPEQVAFQHTLTAKAHALLASWLRVAEAMLRRLLLIEAAAYPKPNTRPLLRAPRQRARTLMSFSAEAPEAWRVAFKVFAVTDRRLPAGIPALATAPAGENQNTACRLEAGGPKLRSAWPLAERYEALIRVFNDPTAYARRLAARLHATPHRLREALRAPPDAAHRVDLFEMMGEDADAAWRPHFTSG